MKVTSVPVPLLPRPTYQQREESADDVRRNGEQLLVNRRLVGEDASHNRRGEEGQALDGDIVQQEDGRNRQRRRRKNALLDSPRVQLVQDDRRANLLPLNSSIREILLLLRQPLGLFDSIRHQRVGGDTDDGGDDAFDEEDLLPCVD